VEIFFNTGIQKSLQPILKVLAGKILHMTVKSGWLLPISHSTTFR